MVHHVLLHFGLQLLAHALHEPRPQPRRSAKQLDIFAVGARTMGVAAPRKRRAAKAEPLFTIQPAHAVLSAPRKSQGTKHVAAPRAYEC